MPETKSSGRGSEAPSEFKASHVEDSGAIRWISSIIDVLADEPLTVDEIADRLGARFPTPESVAVDDLVGYLIGEQLVEEDLDRKQHFILTPSGHTVLEGILASPGHRTDQRPER